MLRSLYMGLDMFNWLENGFILQCLENKEPKLMISE